MENNNKETNQSEIAGRYYGENDQQKDEVSEGLKETHDQVNGYYEDREADKDHSR